MNETPPPTSSIGDGVAPLAAIAQIGIDLVRNVATTIRDAFAPTFTMVVRDEAGDDE